MESWGRSTLAEDPFVLYNESVIPLVPIFVGTALFAAVGNSIWRLRRYGASGFFIGGEPIYEGSNTSLERGCFAVDERKAAHCHSV